MFVFFFCFFTNGRLKTCNVAKKLISDKKKKKNIYILLRHPGTQFNQM